MIRRIDLSVLPADIAAALPRPAVDVADALDAARALVDDVRARGVAALAEQAERFDGVAPERLMVPQSALDDALDGLDAAVRSALEATIARVRVASAAQVPPPTTTAFGDGAVVDQRWQPVARVGLYVPGGKAVYPSSVIMNVVAAQAAGVSEIVVASPPQAAEGGLPNRAILAACALLGVTKVAAMGGAGAIGALAYGVPEAGLAAADVVTGPGNVFVAAAKRVVAGAVRIDAEAGPTEILVIADEQADARLVAADLVSQAEHDELASAVLVTDSAALADAVERELETQVAAMRHRERATASLGGEQSAIVLVKSIDDAVQVSNAYAPEHLEIVTADPDAVLASITSAGAIFIGPYSPVSLGDYAAGSNHVLPTGGQARFSAGLGAATFLTPQQIIRYDRTALAAVRDVVETLATVEDLPAHGDAVKARFA